jgi:hypothetical protein
MGLLKSLFQKKCEYCNKKIKKGTGVVASVKVPEFTGWRERNFCSCEHADRYVEEVRGTKRTKFCPTCVVGN